jgi:hypothetical protein
LIKGDICCENPIIGVIDQHNQAIAGTEGRLPVIVEAQL